MSQTEDTLKDSLLANSKKKIAVLIDPDKHTEDSLNQIVKKSDKAGVDFFMVGGSLLIQPIDTTIKKIKEWSNKPLLLFPGNIMQISDRVDAMLLLSLISGRNPELLIGNHVIAAPVIKRLGIKTISTGYMLIGTGNVTSVEYISNTAPIPSNKIDIAIATSMAGEMLGMQLIYLDAGSGAEHPVPAEMIKAIKSNIKVPLIVGGGIRNNRQVKMACIAGADILVVGNTLEENSEKIHEFVDIVHQF